METLSPNRVLHDYVAEQSLRAVTGPARYWAERLRALPGVVAVLFYGSGLRDRGGDPDGVLDFYLLVERHSAFTRSRLLAAVGTLLPPNVYFFQESTPNGSLRCKAAVMTLEQFRHAAEGRSFTPHIWARFSQPCRILFVRDHEIRERVVGALASSLLTFHARTLPLVRRCSVEEFWSRGLRETYASEIRMESGDRGRTIFQHDPVDFSERSRLALSCLPGDGTIDARGRICSRVPVSRRRRDASWRRGKLLLRRAVVVARLGKATFTFQGAMDYARWKVERHTGLRLPASDFERQHPVIGGLLLYVRSFLNGAFR